MSVRASKERRKTGVQGEASDNTDTPTTAPVKAPAVQTQDGGGPWRLSPDERACVVAALRDCLLEELRAGHFAEYAAISKDSAPTVNSRSGSDRRDGEAA